MAEENNHAADDDIDQEDIRNLHIDGKTPFFPYSDYGNTLWKESFESIWKSKYIAYDFPKKKKSR